MDYKLLDCGKSEKLELLGDYKVRRQAAQAFWLPELGSSTWGDLDAYHVRSSKGGGHWVFNKKIPSSWTVRWGGFQFKMKLTPFGHIGLFPEQAENWSWLEQVIGSNTNQMDILNLFAYTGGSTLACARAGAHVTHVDASKGVVGWARENATLNQLEDRPVRWIVDDVFKFVQREQRRGRTYQGLILDPPTFGRGAQGETWKIEDHLHSFLTQLHKICPNLKLLLISGHSAGFTGQVFAQMSAQVFHLNLEDMVWGEMVTPSASGFSLPSGYFAKWSCL